MTDETRREGRENDGIVSVREAVGDELMRSARAHGSVPWYRRRRSLAAAACVVFIAVPGGVAAAILLPDEPAPFQPAPAPLLEKEAFASCPESVQKQIADLDSLSDYSDSPGYPVEGCPTVEDLQQAGFSPIPASPTEAGNCGRTEDQLSAEECRQLAPSGD